MPYPQDALPGESFGEYNLRIAKGGAATEGGSTIEEQGDLIQREVYNPKDGLYHFANLDPVTLEVVTWGAVSDRPPASGGNTTIVNEPISSNAAYTREEAMQIIADNGGSITRGATGTGAIVATYPDGSSSTFNTTRNRNGDLRYDEVYYPAKVATADTAIRRWTDTLPNGDTAVYDLSLLEQKVPQSQALMWTQRKAGGIEYNSAYTGNKAAAKASAGTTPGAPAAGGQAGSAAPGGGSYGTPGGGLPYRPEGEVPETAKVQTNMGALPDPRRGMTLTPGGGITSGGPQTAQGGQDEYGHDQGVAAQNSGYWAGVEGIGSGGHSLTNGGNLGTPEEVAARLAEVRAQSAATLAGTPGYDDQGKAIKGYAMGGKVVTHRPAMVSDMQTGNPLAMISEYGSDTYPQPETLSFPGPGRMKVTPGSPPGLSRAPGLARAPGLMGGTPGMATGGYFRVAPGSTLTPDQLDQSASAFSSMGSLPGTHTILPSGDVGLPGEVGGLNYIGGSRPYVSALSTRGSLRNAPPATPTPGTGTPGTGTPTPSPVVPINPTQPIPYQGFGSLVSMNSNVPELNAQTAWNQLEQERQGTAIRDRLAGITRMPVTAPMGSLLAGMGQGGQPGTSQGGNPYTGYGAGTSYGGNGGNGYDVNPMPGESPGSPYQRQAQNPGQPRESIFAQQNPLPAGQQWDIPNLGSMVTDLSNQYAMVPNDPAYDDTRAQLAKRITELRRLIPVFFGGQGGLPLGAGIT